MLDICVNSYGNYHSGHEVDPVWIRLPRNSDEELHDILTDIANTFGEDEPEFFICDYEWTDPLYSIRIPEDMDIGELQDMCDEIDCLDEDEYKIVMALLDDGQYDIEDYKGAINTIDYCIIWYGCEDMEDVAREYLAESGALNDVPESLRNYIDFSAYGEDMYDSATFLFYDDYCIEVMW